MTRLFELKDASVEAINVNNAIGSEVRLTVRFDHGPDAHYDRIANPALIAKDLDIVQYICGHLSKFNTLTRNDFVDHISQYLDERLGLI